MPGIVKDSQDAGAAGFKGESRTVVMDSLPE